MSPPQMLGSAKPTKPPSKLPMILGGLVVLLLIVATGGAFALRGVLTTKLIAALQQEVAPADSWQAEFGLTAPLAALVGSPLDVKLTGNGVRASDAPMLSRLNIDAKGLVFSLKTKSLKACRSITFDLFMAEDSIQDFLAKETLAGNLQGLKATLEDGKIRITGHASLNVIPGMALPPGEVTGLATPRIEPPSRLALDFSELTATLPPQAGGGTMNLNSMARQALGLVGFKYDLSRLIPGVRVERCDLTADGLKLSGSIDPGRWVG